MQLPTILPSICVVGDLTLDTVTHLENVDLSQIGLPRYERTAIELVPGGTAFNPAIAAAILGFSRVSLISKIGVDPGDEVTDLAGMEMINSLEHHKVRLFLKKDTQHRTGKTIILYFSSDNRLLVADRAANGTFGTSDVTEDILDVVASSDILYVSGYWLMIPEQAQATFLLISEARRNGKLVVLDVVPHQIYQILDRDTFLKYTTGIQVIVSELNTLRRLFPEIAGLNLEAQLNDLAGAILRHYKVILLRPTNNFYYLLDTRGTITSGTTGYSEAELDQRRGFLDRLTMALLLNYYERLKNY